MYDEIIYDLETQRLFEDITTGNPVDLGISVVCLYKRQLDANYNELSGQMYTFWPDNLSAMWPLFTNVNRVIGFNSIDFDNQILKPACFSYDFNKLNHFDILREIQKVLGHRISLNAIAKSTLNIAKIDSGINAPYYWQKGDKASLSHLAKYCQSDVDITRQVYDFALKNGFLKYSDKWNTLRTVELNFAYLQDQNLLF